MSIAKNQLYNVWIGKWYLHAVNMMMMAGIFLLACTDPAFSQTDTTRVFNKQNNVVNTPFYKIKASATGWGTEGKRMWVKGIRIRTARILTVVVQTGEDSRMEVFPGSELHITFDNGTTDTIETRSFVRSKFEKIGYGSVLQVDYRLPGDEVPDLLQANVTKIVMQFNGGELIFELNKKQSEKFKRFCRLIR